MIPGRYVVIRIKEMEVICFTNDLLAAAEFVKDQQKNEDAELVIYERLQK